MKVLQVQEYNRQGKSRWHEAVDEHNKKYSFEFGGMPYIGCFCYFTNAGMFRTSGYVAYNEHASMWRPTKHEVIEAFIKQYEK